MYLWISLICSWTYVYESLLEYVHIHIIIHLTLDVIALAAAFQVSLCPPLPPFIHPTIRHIHIMYDIDNTYTSIYAHVYVHGIRMYSYWHKHVDTNPHTYTYIYVYVYVHGARIINISLSTYVCIRIDINMLTRIHILVLRCQHKYIH